MRGGQWPGVGRNKRQVGVRIAERCWERPRGNAECRRLDGQEFEAYDRHLMVPELLSCGTVWIPNGSNVENRNQWDARHKRIRGNNDER